MRCMGLQGVVVMHILCLDLEGVLVPEIWVNVAETTGVEEFRLTTRDMPDYDSLMRLRLRLLAEHDLRLGDLETIIEGMEPLPGAADFVDWLGPRYQLAILSDTYYEFARPMMRKLGWPMLLCHRLKVDAERRVVGYQLRQKDPKRQAVKALKALNFKIVAAGDSYNDVTMLAEADLGALFRPAEKVMAEFPQYQVITSYEDFRVFLEQALLKLA